MTELGAIHEDVAFNWGKATELAAELRSTATVLEWQNGERASIRSAARAAWRGRYGDEFDDRVTICTGDAGRFVTSLRAAATGLDELARLAREEQNRREAAREWVAAQEEDKGTGLGIPVVDDIVEGGRDLILGEDDIPPPGPPVQPPTIPIGDPGVVTRSQGPAGPAPVYGTGGVSSAKPDDLDTWVGAAQTLDDSANTRKGALGTLHGEFTSTLGWGKFDASSLIGAIGSWLTWNGTDRSWVATIAQAFRDAGAGTISDATIAAGLRAAGLDAARTSVTYDEPLLWGGAPTSGFANDPVNTASGNFLEAEVDLAAGGLCRFLDFTRTYNSRSDRIGPFGRGWASWATCRLGAEVDGARWVGPDGQEALLPRSSDGTSFVRVAGVAGLVIVEADGLVFTVFGGAQIRFDAAGLPSSMVHGPGTRVDFEHDDGRLVGMHHAGGRSTRLVWDSERIVAVHAWDGRVVRYRYDDQHRLVEVDGGPRGRRAYALDAEGRVLAVTDADGVVEAKNTYDAEGRVVAQVSPHGRRSRFRYLQGRVTMVDDEDAGPVNSYVHDDRGRLVGAIDGHGHELTKAYDEWGNPVRVTERDGSTTVQDWDDRSRLVRRETADGSWHAIAYDDRDRVVTIEASGAATLRYRYEGDERFPAEIVGPAGGVTRMHVEEGLLRLVVDADGVEVRYSYDPHGELAATTDGLGNTTRFERDASGRLTALVTPSGRRSQLDYDGAGRLAAYRDPAGERTRFEWSAAGRLMAITDPTRARRAVGYGDNGEAEQFVDELGQVTTRRFDTLGNLVGLVSPDGAKWELGYDRLCRPVSLGDPTGATWLREYDAVGRAVAEIDPVGVRSSVSFDVGGRVAAIDDGLTSVAFERDEAGRVVVRRRPDGTEVRAIYDRCGRVTCIVDPVGGETLYDYTPAGRIAALTSPAGRTTRFEYDMCGRRAALVDPLGNRWTYGYDEDGQLVNVMSPTGETTRYDYDLAGRLAATVGPSGGATRHEYDAAGRLVATTDPAGGVRRFAWDARGLLVEAVDPNGGVMRCEHDASGQLRALVDPLGGRTTYEYDAAGRVVERRDQLGRGTRWDYDPGGRLRQVILATGERRRWWYDPSGRVRGIGTDDTEGPRVEVERDLLGRPVVVTEPDFRHELAWDELSRLVGKSRNGLGLTWTYDADGLRHAVGTPGGSATTFDHDAAGRVVSAAHPSAGTVTMHHDGSGRLVERATPHATERRRYVHGLLAGHEVGGLSTSIERDVAGRVAAAVVDGERTTYDYDAAGQLVRAAGHDGVWTFRYDAAGRLVAETRPDGQEVTYAYDAAHQLVERRVGGEATRFEYDAAGRRTREIGADGATRSYTWDWRGRLASSGDVALLVDALGDLAKVGADELLWDPVAVFGPALRRIADTSVVGDDQPWATLTPDGTTSWLDLDWQGSVASTERDPWGVPGSGYRGELGVDGLLWLRHRVYDPVTRGFLSTDPLPGAAGTAFVANRYHYAGNDPLGASDPLGLRPMTEADLEAYRQAAAADGGWLDAAGDFLATAGRMIGGGSMVALGFLGALNPLGPLARILPEPLRPLVALGNPLHLLTGGGQAIAAFIAGERDLDQLGRHFVNGPSTTLGQGLAIMGGGDLGYDEQHGMWTSEGTASWTSGRGGTTYGSIFVTPTTEQEIEDAYRQGLRPHGWNGLLEHEAVHSDQWARWGGGIGFPILYGIEEWTSGGEGCNDYEREAGLDEGNYPHSYCGP